VQVVGEDRYTDEPMKNKYSHPHDALQYAAMEFGGLQAIKEESKQRGPRVQPFRPTVPGMGVLG
jgi:hypothetical protein